MTVCRWRLSKSVVVVIMLLSMTTGVAFSQTRKGRFGTGLVFMDREKYERLPRALAPVLAGKADQRSSVDLSARCPAPGDQGSTGSCTAWATAYGLKSFQEEQERDWSLTDDRHLFSPSYVYNRIRLGERGASIEDALKFIQGYGVASLHDFPFVEDDKDSRVPSVDTEARAREFAIGEFGVVKHENVEEVKAYLGCGFPIVVAVYANKEFQELKRGQVYTRYLGGGIGHAMVVVGFDDARHAFKLLNSWGTHWADNGFCWIDYGAFQAMTREAWIAQDLTAEPAPGPVPQPQPTPYPQPKPAPGPISSRPSVRITGWAFEGATLASAVPGYPPVRGISMSVRGILENCQRRNVHVIARFYYPNGMPLYASNAERVYRDLSGVVATQSRVIVPDPLQKVEVTWLMAIPLHALNFPRIGGTIPAATAFYVYIDNFPVFKSELAQFGFQW